MMAAAWERALLDPLAAAPAGLRTWNGSDPQVRFDIHRNNVIVSLIESLRDTYPVCAQLVGDEFFRHMARQFVRQHPPASPVLVHYGIGFAGFVESLEEARPVPYLADVARLEWLYLQAHHAADWEPLSPQAVQSSIARAHTLDELRLVLHPSLQLIDSHHAVASLWAAHQGALEIGEVDPYRPEVAWVIRTGLEVSVQRAGRAEGQWLQALLAGQSLANAMAIATGIDGNFDAARALADLVGRGGIAHVAHVVS